MNNLIEKDQLYIANTYNRFPICLVSGKGATVIDDKQKEYIDFNAGIGVTCLGHGNQKWQTAVIEQLKTLVHTSNLYYTTPDVEVAELLCNKSKMQKVFFANSGAEANEGAIKVARKYANDLYEGKRNEIITLVNSFHGRTISTLSATGQEVFHKDFGPFTQGFHYCLANDLASLNQAVNEKTLAIMIEMVQGEGGVIPLEQAFVDEISKICKQNDILLIVDEVQTGIGRCGSLFAYEQFNIKPDIVTCAKGLGAGLPIGAVILGEKCKSILGYSDHGTTFGGNPVVCAGAKVVLEFMNDDTYQSVNQKGQLIRNRLQKMKHVKKVNGLGLMLGVELDNVKARDLVLKCNNQGVLFLTAKDNLRLLPPLVINEEEINKGMDILEEVLDNWE